MLHFQEAQIYVNFFLNTNETVEESVIKDDTVIKKKKLIKTGMCKCQLETKKVLVGLVLSHFLMSTVIIPKGENAEVLMRHLQFRSVLKKTGFYHKQNGLTSDTL